MAAVGQLAAAARPWSSRPAGGWRPSQLVPGVAPLHRRLAGQQRSDLIFGYNGFGRLTGNETGSVGGGGTGGSVGARPAGCACSTPSSAVRSPGCSRRRWSSSSPGCAARGAPRGPTGTRAALMLWGGWLLVTAPCSASARGSSTRTTRSRWRRRSAPWSASAAAAVAAALPLGARVALAAAVAVTAIWRVRAAGPHADWHPALRVVVLVAGSRAPPPRIAGAAPGAGPSLAVAVAVALAAGLAGPAGVRRSPRRRHRRPAARSRAGAGPAGGVGPGAAGGPGGRSGPGPGRHRPARPGAGPPAVPAGWARCWAGCSNAAHRAPPWSALLTRRRRRTRWVAATVGSTGGRLPAGDRRAGDGDRRLQRHRPGPTLAQFQQCVAAGRIHYFIAGRRPGGGGGGFGRLGVDATTAARSRPGSRALHRHDRRRHDRLRPDDLTT